MYFLCVKLTVSDRKMSVTNPLKFNFTFRILFSKFKLTGMIAVTSENDSQSEPSSLSSSSSHSSGIDDLSRINELPHAFAAIKGIKEMIIKGLDSCWFKQLGFLKPLW